MNIPFVIAPNEIFIGLQQDSDCEFSRKLYYRVKESVSRHFMKQFAFDFGSRGEKLVNLLETYFVASGWGSIKTVNIDSGQKHAIVKVTNNPFSSHAHNTQAQPADHFLRGVFAGIFSAVFKANVECVEAHCIAQGEQDCEFIIKPEQKFDFGNRLVREQLEPET